MPLMERSEFESLLNDLNNPDLEHARRTDILQQLRVAQSNAYQEEQEYSKKISHLEKDNNDLLLSNSKLFRQIGNDLNPPKEEEVKKEFSETITIESLEKGV
jgi:hypothetical protein